MKRVVLGKYLLISFLVTAIMALGTEQSTSQAADEKPINDEMHSMAENVQKIIPYLFSEEKFTADKNYTIINDSLSAIVAKLRHVKNHSQIQSTGKQITIEKLREQMTEALYHFTTQRKVVAKMEITSLLNLCVNCHTQVAGSSTSKIFGTLNIKEMDLSNYEKATVYFLTRDYEMALSLLRKLVTNPNNKDLETPFVREKSLNYILTYFLRLKSDLDATQNELESLVVNKTTEKYILHKIIGWKTEIKKLKLQAQELAKLKNDKDIEKFIDHNLPKIEQNDINDLFEEKEITALYFSGILSDYLDRQTGNQLGSKLQSKILYWLAIYDKRLNSQLFYSLGDAYLQLCIKQTPHSLIAQQCYQVMEEDTLFHYSGSRGTNVPENVNAELIRWKNLSELKIPKKKK